MTTEEMNERILQLKDEKNAVILAHYYVADELQAIADFTGDSFYLSQKAAESTADVIVFCGVRFMGESAKILCPQKTVYLPEPTADCPMAHMATVEGIQKIREELADVAVVCYINSTAELKAHSDVCVTSSNALKIVKALPQENIYFIPDGNLGRFVEQQCPEKNFYFSDGFCCVHAHLRTTDVEKAKSEHKGVKLLVHPECRKEVTELADYVGSTKGIIEFATESEDQEFIIGTEQGVLYELQKRNPDKVFYPLTADMVCRDMKKLRLESLLNALEGKVPEVVMPEEERLAAEGCLQEMLELGK
jgi:quinolinate synthase